MLKIEVTASPELVELLTRLAASLEGLTGKAAQSPGPVTRKPTKATPAPAPEDDEDEDDDDGDEDGDEDDAPPPRKRGRPRKATPPPAEDDDEDEDDDDAPPPRKRGRPKSTTPTKTAARDAMRAATQRTNGKKVRKVLDQYEATTIDDVDPEDYGDIIAAFNALK